MNNKDMKDVELLIRQVMDCAKNIRRQLGPGYVESVYKNAMVLELRKLGLHHETEKLTKYSWSITLLPRVSTTDFSSTLEQKNFNSNANTESINHPLSLSTIEPHNTMSYMLPCLKKNNMFNMLLCL